MSLEALFAGSAVAKILDIYLKNHKENPQYSMKEIAELSHIHYGTTSKAVNTLENIQILVISGSIGRKRYYRLNSENSIVVPLINFYEGIITTSNKNQENEIAKVKMPSKTRRELREHLKSSMEDRGGSWHNPFSELTDPIPYAYRSQALDVAIKFFMCFQYGESRRINKLGIEWSTIK